MAYGHIPCIYRKLYTLLLPVLTLSFDMNFSWLSSMGRLTLWGFGLPILNKQCFSAVYQEQKWERKSLVQMPKERKADACLYGNVSKPTGGILELARTDFFTEAVVVNRTIKVRML